MVSGGDFFIFHSFSKYSFVQYKTSNCYVILVSEVTRSLVTIEYVVCAIIFPFRLFFILVVVVLLFLKEIMRI